MKKAVAILIESCDYGILSLNNNNNWGLPGGKVSSNEKEIVAATRELYEETGILVPEYCLVPIYLGKCLDYTTLTYMLNYDSGMVNYLFKQGIKTEPGVEVGFLTANQLSDPKYSKYYDYNKSLFSFCKTLYPENSTFATS